MHPTIRIGPSGWRCCAVVGGVEDEADTVEREDAGFLVFEIGSVGILSVCWPVEGSVSPSALRRSGGGHRDLWGTCAGWAVGPMRS